jgi:hypothetical protein
LLVDPSITRRRFTRRETDAMSVPDVDVALTHKVFERVLIEVCVDGSGSPAWHAGYKPPP